MGIGDAGCTRAVRLDGCACRNRGGKSWPDAGASSSSSRRARRPERLGSMGRRPRAGLGGVAKVAGTQASGTDDHSGSGVACDRHGGGVRHRSRCLAVELDIGLAAIVKLPLLRLGHLPVRLGLAGLQFDPGTSPFGSGSFPFGSGTSPFGSGTFPFGSGSPGSSSTASGGPSNALAIAARVDPGLVDVNTTLSYLSEQAAGTGIVLTRGGEVLTNNHVIDGATSISVTDLGNGRVYAATVVGYDRSSDIAVLQLHGASGLKVASLGDSSTVRVGEAVVGIGNAGGAGGTPSVAGGSVTALHQSITATEQDGGNPENLKGLIEVNAGIQAGDSGGPLVDTGGKVVGMDSAASAGFSFQTTGTDGYAIPINSAVAIAKKIESGNASATVHVGTTAFLGVQVYSTQSGSSPSGAVIHVVVPGSPAASAGLAAGDVITSLAGKKVGSAPALMSLMQSYHPGERVHVSWTGSTGGRHGTTLQLASGPPA